MHTSRIITGLLATFTLAAGASEPYISPMSKGQFANTSGAYEGFIYAGSSSVQGTLTFNAKMAVKKNKDASATTNWTFSAKVIRQASTVSLSGKWTNALSHVTLTNARGGERLVLTPLSDILHGDFTDGAGNVFGVIGSKHVFADKKDGDAQALLNDLRGLYNIGITGLGEDSGWSFGFLSLSVGNAGAVKVSGRLGDGTGVSGSGRLLASLNHNGWLCVALHRPLYSKRGYLSGLLWLDPETGIIRVDRDNDWFLEHESPADGLLKRQILGGWFGAGKAIEFVPNMKKFTAHPVGDGYWFPPLPNVFDPDWKCPMWTEHVPITTVDTTDKNGKVTGVKFNLPKPTSPVLDRAINRYTYPGDNVYGAKLTYNAKTGLFKGSLKVYCDGWDVNGKAVFRAFNVPYTGVMLRARSPAYEYWSPGWGIGTTTINKEKVPVSVLLFE